MHYHTFIFELANTFHLRFLLIIFITFCLFLIVDNSSIVFLPRSSILWRYFIYISIFIPFSLLLLVLSFIHLRFLIPLIFRHHSSFRILANDMNYSFLISIFYSLMKSLNWKGIRNVFLLKREKKKTSDKNPLLAVKKFLSFLICLYYFFYYFCPICFVFFLSFSFWTAVELIRCEIKAAFISEKTKKTRQWARNGKLAN